VSSTSGMRVVLVICRRELIRFARQPARLAAAVGTPALLWLFMAAGFAQSLQPERLTDGGYATFLLPGIMALVAVFAAVFSSISIIEERQEGWLRAVLVSPAPRWSIALGKTIGGALVAWVQAAALLPVVLLLDVTMSAVDVLLALIALGVMSFAMTALGVVFAWRSASSAAFHAVINLLFLPMWLLSGAFFPAEGAARWLSVIMRINPLTWCVESVRGPITGDDSLAWLGASIAFASVMLALATLIVSTRSKRDA
jgi:ABC-2 type transport system permease protein